VKILLDENMPHNLVKALRVQGHDVESVHTLGIAGVKNLTTGLKKSKKNTALNIYWSHCLRNLRIRLLKTS